MQKIKFIVQSSSKFSMHTTCPDHLIFLYLITIITRLTCEDQKLQAFLLWKKYSETYLKETRLLKMCSCAQWPMAGSNNKLF
jgi:hypothetical protein